MIVTRPSCTSYYTILREQLRAKSIMTAHLPQKCEMYFWDFYCVIIIVLWRNSLFLDHLFNWSLNDSNVICFIFISLLLRIMMISFYQYSFVLLSHITNPNVLMIKKLNYCPNYINQPYNNPMAEDAQINKKNKNVNIFLTSL